MIRRVCFDELEIIYNERIRADFPRMECRPLPNIHKLFKQGRYTCLVLEEESQIVAYATFLYDESVGSVLLDNFAVDKVLRGKGSGSRFLSMLQEYWSDKRGIMLECEQPKTAKSCEEKELRLRRIEFYKRGGAEVTPLYWRAFGVDYHILYLHTHFPAAPVNIADDLQALYSLSLSRISLMLFTRIRTE